MISAPTKKVNTSMRSIPKGHQDETPRCFPARNDHQISADRGVRYPVFSAGFAKPDAVSVFFRDAGAAIRAVGRRWSVYPTPSLGGAVRFWLRPLSAHQARGFVSKARAEVSSPWAEVQRITLAPDLYDRVSRRSYLVFYAEERPRPVTGRSEFHPHAFGLQYRKGLPEAIAKYCDLEIENLSVIEQKR